MCLPLYFILHGPTRASVFPFCIDIFMNRKICLHVGHYVCVSGGGGSNVSSVPVSKVAAERLYPTPKPGVGNFFILEGRIKLAVA
jgi:hypothetical protein